ncbi:hypothetical protein LOK49_LG07G00757 [Camellia lanceoleosa]|uniref:Uncharacterized protein n=1 Tax=Camellia lanceoleosa TaxID=1840588 RepID=A0ACC0H2L7_9ERIC|nr:hypothetical protein LOK49_LG07G00757 [Camellia lanceoleosa]
MGVPDDTYARGSVSGNMLTIRPTTASTSQTNPRENGNFGLKKIMEAQAVCLVCWRAVEGDAIKVCECDYSLLHPACQATWSQKSGKNCVCKKEFRIIHVTVDREQISEGRQNRSWVSALKSNLIFAYQHHYGDGDGDGRCPPQQPRLPQQSRLRRFLYNQI